MNRQRIRAVRRRLAVFLTVAMMAQLCLPASAAGAGGNMGKIKVITGFTELAENVGTIYVPAGADEATVRDLLDFPDTIEAWTVEEIRQESADVATSSNAEAATASDAETATASDGEEDSDADDDYMEDAELLNDVPTETEIRVTWEIDADRSISDIFDADEANDGAYYTYVPVLPETDEDGNILILEAGVELPEIHVMIGDALVRLFTAEELALMQADAAELSLADQLRQRELLAQYQETFGVSTMAFEQQENEAYTIATPGQLAELAVYVNAGPNDETYGTLHDQFYNAAFSLANDIDLCEYSPTGTEGDAYQYGWVPIGNMFGSSDDSSNRYFAGTFDGKGKKISNLKISGTDGQAVSGLFGYVNGGTIQNINVAEIDINICTVTNPSFAELNIGGIAGCIVNGTIEDSGSAGNIIFTHSLQNTYVGGMVGSLYASDAVKCYSSVAINTCGNSISLCGGLSGRIYNESSLSNCYATGGISAEADMTGGAGGLVGEAYDSEITTCYATGDVCAKGDFAFVGGLVELADNTDITACYATGTVGANAISGSNAGGLVAMIDVSTDQTSTITDCYATGTVILDGQGGQDEYSGAGGLAGLVDSSVTIHNSVALNESVTANKCSIAGAVIGYSPDSATAAVNNCWYWAAVTVTANSLPVVKDTTGSKGGGCDTNGTISIPFSEVFNSTTGLWNFAANGLPTLREVGGNQSSDLPTWVIDAYITENSLYFANVELDKDFFVYNGEEHIPTVTVTLFDKTLKKDNDYVLTYIHSSGNDKDFTSSGTITVTITAKEGSEYTDSTATYYTIGEDPVYGYQLYTNSEIGMMFFITQTDELLEMYNDDANAFIRFLLPNRSSQIISLNDCDTDYIYDATTDSNICYYVPVCKVYAKEMADTITMEILRGDGTVYTKHTCSVKEYAESIIQNKEKYNFYQRRRASALLNYGAASQVYFDYNTTTLANNDGEDYPVLQYDGSEASLYEEVTSENMEGYKYKYTKENADSIPGILYQGSDLTLLSDITLRLYYKIVDDEKSIDNFTFNVTSSCSKHKLNNVAVDPVESKDYPGYYYIEISGLNINELGDAGAVINVDGTTLNYTVYSNIYSTLNSSSDENLKDVLKKLVIYCGITAPEA